jgi:hypothetical protein
LIANEHDGVFLLRTPSNDFSVFISPTICSAFNTRIAPMAGKADAARAALHKVKALHEDFHEPILAELDKAGLLDHDAPRGNGGQWHRVGDLHAKGTKPQTLRECAMPLC